MKKTKLYISTKEMKFNNNKIYYFLYGKGIWVEKIHKIGDYNYIIEVEADSDNLLSSAIGDFNVKGSKIQIRRIFKSMRILKKYPNEPYYSFLDSILILLSARLQNTTIKIISKDKANSWKQELIKRWQKELDNPVKFKELNIKPTCDIVPNGEIRFHINRINNYIVTYLEGDISKYYKNGK